MFVTEDDRPTSLKASDVSVDLDPSISFCSSDVRQRVSTPINTSMTDMSRQAIVSFLQLLVTSDSVSNYGT